MWGGAGTMAAVAKQNDVSIGLLLWRVWCCDKDGRGPRLVAVRATTKFNDRPRYCCRRHASSRSDTADGENTTKLIVLSPEVE